MPAQILPQLSPLLNQMSGIISYYRHILDDEFMFGAAAQIPHVATVFDRVGQGVLHFAGEDVSLSELLTLIAYRYGFEGVRMVGNGGYAIVLGHEDNTSFRPQERRVLRFVADHHVRDIVAKDAKQNDFDVQLNAHGEPIRGTQYPLLLSDLFLMPRHTTKLIFRDNTGSIIQAGGYPAILHCQLLPEIWSFTHSRLDQRMAKNTGDLLESALTTLGVSIADAHGGNGGVLIGADSQPILWQPAHGDTHYVPVVLDYGYYAKVGSRMLATILIRHGLTPAILRESLGIEVSDTPPYQPTDAWITELRALIEASPLPRSAFGKLLHQLQPHRLNPDIWVDRAEHNWHTLKERMYPALQAQSRLSRLYPDYDEVIFPQRIEEYNFVIPHPLKDL